MSPGTSTGCPTDRFQPSTTSCTDDQKDPGGTCIDAKHPNDWSYPERVMGFATDKEYITPA